MQALRRLQASFQLSLHPHGWRLAQIGAKDGIGFFSLFRVLQLNYAHQPSLHGTAVRSGARTSGHKLCVRKAKVRVPQYLTVRIGLGRSSGLAADRLIARRPVAC